ncbi:MAG: TIGR02453 family protein [Bacteroidetes bacterium]|nr:MAG: TIGR02453 family protein [Bacteroidota bacterium]
MNETIPREVFSFLNRLDKNNNRDWFTENKTEFKELEKEVKQFYNQLFERVNAHDEVDKLKIFRIYRDVRFSKDKTPYKTHFGGSIHRKKPELRGGYYLHIQPNNESFIATGFWEPHKDDLFRIRKEFEMDASEMRKLISAKKFKAIWGGLEGDEVKTAPKGFDKAHENIDLIKKKMYIFTRKFTDKEVTSQEFLNTIDESFRSIRPFFNYMSDVLTTNLNGESLI